MTNDVVNINQVKINKWESNICVDREPTAPEQSKMDNILLCLSTE